MIAPKPLADPALVPGAAAILRCIREVIESDIAPALQGVGPRSAIATIQPMLRYVEQLVEHQGQALFDEERHLADLLPEAADWLAASGRPGDAATIRATLEHGPDAAIYPSLAVMSDRLARLREHVCTVLAALHGRGANGDPAGDALHERLRGYIAWQIEVEGRLVEPAFLGRGPRR